MAAFGGMAAPPLLPSLKAEKVRNPDKLRPWRAG